MKKKILLGLCLVMLLTFVVPHIANAYNPPNSIYATSTEVYYNINGENIPRQIRHTAYRNGYVYTGYLRLDNWSQSEPGKVYGYYSGTIYLDPSVTPTVIPQDK